MSNLIESLEPRCLLSATHHHPGRHVPRLDSRVAQIQIEARTMQADLKITRSLGLNFSMTASREVHQVAAKMHPVTTADRQLLTSVLTAVNQDRKLILAVNAVITENQRVLLAVRPTYQLVIQHPTDQFARSRLTAVLGDLPTVGGLLRGMLTTQIPAAQQTLDADLNAIATARPTLQPIISAATAGIDDSAQALSGKAATLQIDTDTLVATANQAL
jgi:hypothetical protein